MAGVTGQGLKKWTVELSSAVDIAPITRVQDQQLVFGIDTTKVVIKPLQVKVLEGPNLSPQVLNALQSPALAAAATAFVNSLPQLTLTPPMLTSHLSYTQSLHTGSVWWDKWFSVDVAVSHIIVKPLEKALTVAIDFAGFTTGNANALVDLTKVKGIGSIYSYTIVQNNNPYDDDSYYASNPSTEPEDFYYMSLSQFPEPTGGDIAATINISFISTLVEQQIAPQIRFPKDYSDIVWDGTPEGHPNTLNGTPIRSDVDLLSVSLNYAQFDTSQSDIGAIQDGLEIGFEVYVKEGPWFSATGRIYVQVYYQGADGSTEFVTNIPDVWKIHVAKVEVDEPWWAGFAVVAATIWVSAAMPIIAPAAVIAGGALVGSAIPGMLAGIEGSAEIALEKGTKDAMFPPPWSGPLPGLTKPTWYGRVAYASFTADGIDTALSLTAPPPQPWPDLKPTSLTAVGGPSDIFQAYAGVPFHAAVKLGDDFAGYADKVTLAWRVRRGDTMQIILSKQTSYADPAGNGIQWQWQLPGQYYMDKFIVECTVSLTLGNQKGEIGKLSTEIPIKDRLDRFHKYVEWGPYTVSFPNPDESDTWFRHRKSRIHRTAVGARCKMLRDRDKFKTPRWHADRDLVYRDSLPFDWNDLNLHRKPLCEYCFFGGPASDVPYPEDDRFPIA